MMGDLMSILTGVGIATVIIVIYELAFPDTAIFQRKRKVK
jgi:hypothetical protein